MTTMKFLPAARWTTTAPAPRQSLTSTARPASERQMTLAAENAPLRITYGRDRLGAQIANVLLHAGYYVVQCVWGEGPIDAVESVTFADAAVPAGVQQQHYTGTAGQSVNSWLVDAFAAKAVVYEDALPYVAYSVFRIPITIDADWSNVTAVIRGRLLYDPRTTTTAYNTNAALAYADYLSHTRYGAGRTIDWSSVIAPADACDEQINGRARRAIGYTIDVVAPVEDHLETLRTYAGCLRPVIGSSGWRMIADRPASVVKHYDHAAGNILSISPIRKRGVRDTPTLIRLTWTDTSQVPWRDVPTIVALPGVIEGTSPRRESDIPLPGIQDASQAEREAIERLNKLTLEDITFELEVFDDGVETEPGDVVTVSHPVGLSEKPMRVLGVEGAHGRYRLTLAEYDPAMYSDEIVADPTFPDTSLPTPADPLPPTGLTLTEELFQKQTGVYSSRVRVAWTAPADYPFVDSYRVIGYVGGEPVFNGTAQYGATEWPSPEVEEGVLHTIEVRTVSSVGVLSDAVSDTIEPLGKFLPPGDVPQITGSYEAGVIRLSWQAAVDIDIWRYELRTGADGVAWDDATLVDRVDGLRIELTGYPLGTHAFIVRALDSVGLYSLNDARVNITVAAPAVVTGFTGFEVGGEVRLSWNAVPGIGVANYEIRYGAASVTWENATLLNRTDTLRLVSRDVAEGTFDFLIRAISVDGFYSDTDARHTLTVTKDSSAFLVDAADFDTPTLSNMAEYKLGRTDTVRRFVTEDGVAWGTKFANAMSTYTNPLYTYGNVASSWTSESYDFAQSISGNWAATFSAEAVAGTITREMQLGPDGSNWTGYSSLAAKTGARFARLVASAASGSFLHVTLPTAEVRIDAIPRTEQGTVAALASGGALVQLSNEYSAAKSIALASQGTAARTPVYDRVLVAPAMGLMYSGTSNNVNAYNESLHIIDPLNRVCQSGDYVEYDVFIVSQSAPGDLIRSPGGVAITVSDGQPVFSFTGDNSPTGVWITRKHSLSAQVGYTLSDFRIRLRASNPAYIAAVYRNIRITDGSGNTRQTVWNGGEPTSWTATGNSGMTNIQGGPSNSFIVYQFDSGGTQVSGNVSWEFNGI